MADVYDVAFDMYRSDDKASVRNHRRKCTHAPMAPGRRAPRGLSADGELGHHRSAEMIDGRSRLGGKVRVRVSVHSSGKWCDERVQVVLANSEDSSQMEAPCVLRRLIRGKK